MPSEQSMSAPAQEALGPNAWLVDEMYERYRADPSSVSESWREFFTDYQSDTEAGSTAGQNVAQPATGRKGGGEPGSKPASAVTPPPPPPETSKPTKPAAPAPAISSNGAAEPQPLRGAAARIVANMEASLEVPTATSFREVPAKLL